MNARQARLVVGLALVLALGVVATAMYKPWRPLRYGWASPPVAEIGGLEPALVRLIDASTAAVRAEPYSAEAWGRLGLVYDVHDLPAEAATCYARAARLDPDDFRWIYFLGLTTQENDHDAAQRFLLEARAIRDDYAPLELHLARGFFDAGDLLQAETHAQRAAALDPSLVRPHVTLARIALARDDPERALAHLEAAQSRGPKGSEVDLLLAETHRRLGNTDDAARYADAASRRAAFEEYPDRVRMESQWDVGVTTFWRQTRSRSYLDAGLVDRAIGEWSKALEADPGSARAWSELGAIYAGVGDRDRAIEAYGRALALDADLHAVRHQLGLLLVRSGRAEAGLPLLKASCEALPESADLRANYAIALARNGRDDEAATSYARAGELYAASDRFDRAVDAYRKTLARRPDDAATTTALAWLLATCPDETQRDAAESIRLVEPLSRDSNITDARVLDALAAAYAAHGDFDDAIRTAEAALTIATDFQRPSIAARLDGYRRHEMFVDE